jgi:ABC-2 type transport system permease protein
MSGVGKASTTDRVSLRRLVAIVDKEWAETVRNRLLLLTVFVMPAVLLLMPVVVLYAMRGEPADARDVARYVEASPQYAGMDPTDVMQIVVVSQFLFFYLMMPSFIPMTVAAFSIIGEKQARSLEPLLATPASTLEILLGKTTAAVVPAVAVTWLSYCIFAAASYFVASPAVWQAIVAPLWITAMLVIAPLLAILSVFLGIVVSSRVNDTRIAQQIGGVVVLPIIGLALAQTTGLILVSVQGLALAALALAVVDVLALMLGIRLFQRDRILSQWR